MLCSESLMWQCIKHFAFSIPLDKVFWVFVAVLMIWGDSLESIAGRKLRENAIVIEHQFTPAHDVFNGRFLNRMPDRWRLRVRNQNGQGWIEVTQSFYDSVTDGESLTVTGAKGRLSGHWYLKEAHKEA